LLLLGEGVEMFSNMFWIRDEENVYFNIKGEVSVIQASLRGGECNLLFILLEKLDVTMWLSYNLVEELSIDADMI